MNGRTLGILLAGGLLAATAVLASPVAASLGRYSEADSIRFSWSCTIGVNDYVDETWWAVRGHDTPDNFVERLPEHPRQSGRAGRRCGFRSQGFPGHRSATARELEHRYGEEFAVHHVVYAETPRDLTAVLGFYRPSSASVSSRDGGRTGPGRDHLHDGPWTGPAPAFPSGRQDDRRTFAAQAGYRECRPPAEAEAGKADARQQVGRRRRSSPSPTRPSSWRRTPARNWRGSDSAAAKYLTAKRSICRPAIKVTLKSRAARPEPGVREVAANETSRVCWPARTASCCRCGFIDAHRPLAVRQTPAASPAAFARRRLRRRCPGTTPCPPSSPAPGAGARLADRPRFGSSISSKSMLWARPRIRRMIFAAAKPTVSANSRCM